MALKSTVREAGEHAGILLRFEALFDAGNIFLRHRTVEDLALEQIDRLIEQYGDMRLPELRLILPGDCPQTAPASIADRCSVNFPQLLPPQGG